MSKSESWMEKMNGGDKDIKTPEHDKIVQLVLKCKKDIMNELFGTDVNTSFETHAEIERVLSNNGYVKGFIDIVLSRAFYDRDEGNGTECAVIEIKTSVESLGAILRELQFYRSSCNQNYTTFCLVCPEINSEWKQIILGQSFRVLETNYIQALHDKVFT